MQASIFGACPKPCGMAEVGAPISLDWVAVHPDYWCVCLCYLHFCSRKFRRWRNVPSGTGSPMLLQHDIHNYFVYKHCWPDERQVFWLYWGRVWAGNSQDAVEYVMYLEHGFVN